MLVILKTHVPQLLAVILFDRHLVKIYSLVVHLLIARMPSVFRLMCCGCSILSVQFSAGICFIRATSSFVSCP